MNYIVNCEIEYHKIMNKYSIGLIMMVKDEEKRIHVSLNSIISYVDAIVIYDTGSTDNTISIIKNFCQEHKINLHLIQGTFVDFSTSRNVLFDYCDKLDLHYLLLLDSNDELQGGSNLVKLAKEMYKNETYTGFLLYQHWWSGVNDKYFNIRFLKNKCGWRYKGSVHEWLSDSKTNTVFKGPDDIVLYQDRTMDGNKSAQRFSRDKELLLQDYKINRLNPEPRILFYLAQTCQCLLIHDEALYYSKLRLELGGFEEERFHSFMRCGNCCVALNHSWSDIMPWYIKAYEHTARAEPLIKLAEYYRAKQIWHLSYLFSKQSCELLYPTQCILFVDNGIYEYYRWHLLGIIGFYAERYIEGKIGCETAIKAGLTNKQYAPNIELDKKNLQIYIEREQKLNTVQITKIDNKKDYIIQQTKELRIKYPGLPDKQIYARANKLWKSYKKE